MLKILKKKEFKTNKSGININNIIFHVVVRKKLIPLAVNRNKIKRRIKNAIRIISKNEILVNNNKKITLIIIYDQKTLDFKFLDLLNELQQLLI